MHGLDPGCGQRRLFGENGLFRQIPQSPSSGEIPKSPGRAGLAAFPGLDLVSRRKEWWHTEDLNFYPDCKLGL